MTRLLALLRPPDAPESPGEPQKDPWRYWSPSEVARAAQADVGAVTDNWPHIQYALDELGASDRPTLAAAIGTVAVETASTFRPIHEYGTPADWAGYDGGPAYAGRGYIQLTHRYNYQSYGDRIGVDLVDNPDLALDPSVAAWVLAYYFVDHGIPDQARAGNWPEVRRRVQGGTAGLSRLLLTVEVLGV